MFKNIGLPELLVVLVILLLLFGSKRLPELSKGLGKAVKDFRSSMGSEDKK